MKCYVNGIRKCLKCCLIISIFLFIAAGSVNAADMGDIQNALDQTNAFYYLQDELVSGNDFADGGDWEALGIRSSGYDISAKYYIQEEPAEASTVKASDYARAILGAIAADVNESVIDDYLSDLAGMQNESGDFNGDYTSLNQTIWAVIAFDFAAANGYPTEEYTDYDAASAVTYVLIQQDPGGGFDESGWGIDVDGTAHTLIALASHQEIEGCPAAVEKALAYLQTRQIDSGAFLDAFDGESPDSTAAVIEALVALGEDPNNLDTEIWQGNMVDALLDYQLENGGFYASWDPGPANAMTTYHALLALADANNGCSKYQNTVPSTNGLSLYIDAPAGGFELDNDAALQIMLSNADNSDQEILIIMALYDLSSEQMISYSSLESDIEGEGELGIHCGLTIPASGTYDVRVMLWDSWNDANPLLPVCHIPVD